eukprot:scaffold676942_cov151-Prasinocladus_malaysianus.AAC.1
MDRVKMQGDTTGCFGLTDDVEPQAGSGHGDRETPDIPEVPHSLGAHQAEQDDVVLLPLVLVHRRHLPRPDKIDNITNQPICFLLNKS